MKGNDKIFNCITCDQFICWIKTATEKCLWIKKRSADCSKKGEKN